jgi:hypothetical protein
LIFLQKVARDMKVNVKKEGIRRYLTETLPLKKPRFPEAQNFIYVSLSSRVFLGGTAGFSMHFTNLPGSSK